MAEDKEPNNLTNVGETGDEKVIVGGREFDSYQDAAEKWSKSYVDEQAELTRSQQENALLKKEKEDELLKKEKGKEDAKKGPPEQLKEGWLDWNDAEKSIEERINARLKQVEDRIVKEKEERSQMTYDERLADANREIKLAQTDIAELKDEKVMDKVAKELQTIPISYISDKLIARHPEALREAGSNRVKLGYYYLCLLDGTIDEVLKKGASRRTGTSFTEGGSSGTTIPSGEMSDGEFNKLSPEKQVEHLRKEMLQKSKTMK